MTSQHEMAQAIVSAHQASLGLVPQARTAPAFTTEAPVYLAAKQACLDLGFIDIDAECLAHAWQAMTLRTGRFDPSQWPAEPVDFGMRPWPRPDAFASCPRQLGLYAVLPDAAWVAGADLDDTAAALGCSTGTVKSQTARGLAKLRDALAMPPEPVTTAAQGDLS